MGTDALIEALRKIKDLWQNPFFTPVKYLLLILVGGGFLILLQKCAVGS